METRARKILYFIKSLRCITVSCAVSIVSTVLFFAVASLSVAEYKSKHYVSTTGSSAVFFTSLMIGSILVAIQNTQVDSEKNYKDANGRNVLCAVLLPYYDTMSRVKIHFKIYPVQKDRKHFSICHTHVYESNILFHVSLLRTLTDSFTFISVLLVEEYSLI